MKTSSRQFGGVGDVSNPNKLANAVRRALKAAMVDEVSEVETVLAILAARLLNVNRGSGRFGGLGVREREQAANRAIDSAISMLSRVVGFSVRAVFAVALAELGGDKPRVRRDLAA